MLTSQDLQDIGLLLDQRLEVKFEEKLAPIRKDVNRLERTFEEQLTSVRKDIADLDTKSEDRLTGMQKDIRKIRKDSAYVVDVLDRADIHLRRRVDVIEKHLHLPQV